MSKIVEIAPSARPGQLSNPQIARAREALVHRAIAARSKSDLLDLCDANDLSGSAYTDEIARLSGAHRCLQIGNPYGGSGDLANQISQICASVTQIANAVGSDLSGSAYTDVIVRL